MDISSKETRKIYKEFGKEKIICGIRNPELKIKHISYSWIYFLVILIVYFPLNIKNIISYGGGIVYVRISILVAIFLLSLYKILSLSFVLYFDNNNLIYENKLKKKKIMDINKYPRINVRYRKYKKYSGITEEYEDYARYDLHIEQNEEKIVLNIDALGAKKIYLLLDSLQTKEIEEATEEQWKESANTKERTFSSYMDFLNEKEKIVGVKNKNLKMNIAKGSNRILKFLYCVLIVCIGIIVYLLLNQKTNIAIFIILFVGVLLFVLSQEKNELFLKISYPNEHSIKINKYILDYKNNNSMIYITKIQLPKSDAKYDYQLIIPGKGYIKLYDAQEKQIGEFIDNLIFGEK